MTSSFWKRFTLYSVLVLSMLFGVLQLDFGTVGAATCCLTEDKCGKLHCCVPYPQQVACSATQANYCRKACGPVPD
jgi:hypothetical protein